jgi:Tfp pilus assembly protein PilN
MENKTISMLVIAATLAVLTTLVAVQTQAALATNNGFSDAVKAQAQSQDHGSFGQHQSDAAQDNIYSDGQKGLGEFNCNTCTTLKGG